MLTFIKKPQLNHFKTPREIQNNLNYNEILMNSNLQKHLLLNDNY